MRDGLAKSLLSTVTGLNKCGLIDNDTLKTFRKNLDPQDESFAGQLPCRADELIYLCSDDGV